MGRISGSPSDVHLNNDGTEVISPVTMDGYRIDIIARCSEISSYVGTGEMTPAQCVTWACNNFDILTSKMLDRMNASQNFTAPKVLISLKK